MVPTPSEENVTVKGTGVTLSLTIALIFSAGCSHWTTMRRVPPPAANLPGAPSSTATLAIDSVSGTLNGNPTPPNSVFVQSYASAMRETGFFAPVLEPSMAHQAPRDALHMTIQFAESIDSHQGAAFVKGLFIGLTLYLLAPALPLNGDMEQRIDVSLTLPDGRVRRFEAETAARLNYHLFANTTLADAELTTKVGTSNLQAIVARIREDAELRKYLGSLAEHSSVPHNQ